MFDFVESGSSNGVENISLKKVARIEPGGKTDLDGWSKIIGSCNTKAPLFRGASGGKFIIFYAVSCKKRCPMLVGKNFLILPTSSLLFLIILRIVSDECGTLTGLVFFLSKSL